MDTPVRPSNSLEPCSAQVPINDRPKEPFAKGHPRTEQAEDSIEVFQEGLSKDPACWAGNGAVIVGQCGWRDAGLPGQNGCGRRWMMVHEPVDGDELVQFWTLTPADRAVLGARRGALLLAFALQLKHFATFARYGRRSDFAPDVVSYVAGQVGVDQLLFE